MIGNNGPQTDQHSSGGWELPSNEGDNAGSSQIQHHTLQLRVRGKKSETQNVLLDVDHEATRAVILGG